MTEGSESRDRVWLDLERSGDRPQGRAGTLVASWAAYARGAEGAEVLREPGVSIGVIPRGPERGSYNNALLERGLGEAARRQAIEATEAAYASVGIERSAAWVHDSDGPMRTELEGRSYLLDTTTRVMGVVLAELDVPRPLIEVGTASWSDHLRYPAVEGLPEGLLAGVEPSAFRVLSARFDDDDIATALAFHRDGDCRIYNVGTLPWARRRGLGTAVTAALHSMPALADARRRACRRPARRNACTPVSASATSAASWSSSRDRPADA